MKATLPLTALGFAIALAATIEVYDSSVASAQSTQQFAKQSVRPKNRTRRYQPPPKPKNRVVSGYRGVLGIRANCAALKREQSPIALMPEEQSTTATGKVTTEVWAQTSVARPTLWFYVPYTSGDGLEAEFTLRDAAGNQGKFSVTLPPTPGIISVQLSENLQLAALNQPYQWFLKVRCADTTDNDKNDTLSGWIQRVPLPATLQQIQTAPLVQRVDRYAEQGLWLDALTAAAELRRTNSQNSAWSELLAEIGLEPMTQVAIAP
jgi:hypothetical protein